MKLILTNQSGEYDITQLITSMTWSGDISQVARKLEFGMVVSPSDSYIPKVYIGLGNRLRLYDNSGKELFRGTVFFKEKSYHGSEMKVTAYDNLIYLTKSKMSRNFKKMMPETITQQVCSMLGVTPGSLVSTGVPVDFIASAITGYDIIMSAYTRAAWKNGKAYFAIMQQGKLDVMEKGQNIVDGTLDSTVNIMDSNYSETIESMVNQFQITDENGNTLKYYSDDSLIKPYGMIQDVMQKEQGKDPVAAAKNSIKGVERKASLQCLGDASCIAGYGVKVKEAYTGLTGLFWIDSDSHTFQDGQHTMQLTLDFVNTMDAKE